MPFTRQQALAGALAFRQEIKASGLTSMPATKDQYIAALNGILAIWEGASYKSAVNSAINTAIPGNTLTAAQKRLVHEAAMRAAIEAGIL